ncbi:MAG: hypothetical protein GY742_03490 [Hyphomicrobiales bacterium]|nr:hypothetical protein [Hyphomicrobiales bacterium]
MFKYNTIPAMALAIASTFGVMSAPTEATAEEVYFIRGAMNVFSAGMNQMTDRLRSRGVNAKALSNGQWSGIARDIINRNKSGRVSYPIIIAGHSVGGQEAPKFNDMLAKAGIPVALVIGVDPGWAAPPPFTAGSTRVVNFWVGGTARGNPYRSTGGFRGTIRNIDIRSFSKADHVQIDKDRGVQSRIIGLVMSAL